MQFGSSSGIPCNVAQATFMEGAACDLRARFTAYATASSDSKCNPTSVQAGRRSYGGNEQATIVEVCSHAVPFVCLARLMQLQPAVCSMVAVRLQLSLIAAMVHQWSATTRVAVIRTITSGIVSFYRLQGIAPQTQHATLSLCARLWMLLRCGVSGCSSAWAVVWPRA